jgi:hypothetical protein
MHAWYRAAPPRRLRASEPGSSTVGSRIPCTSACCWPCGRRRA